MITFKKVTYSSKTKLSVGEMEFPLTWHRIIRKHFNSALFCMTIFNIFHKL